MGIVNDSQIYDKMKGIEFRKEFNGELIEHE